MSSITVVCPNGRRQVVKVTPNTNVLEIIEEVCQKQGLVADEYGLLHQRRLLDVTLDFRLTGVANNAQLELKRLDVQRKLGDVIIVLQLEDGTRLSPITFTPSHSLLAVVEAHAAAAPAEQAATFTPHEDTQFACTYMNETRIGRHQLEHTTLKDFGLTNGRTILRFSNRVFDQEQVERANVEFQKIMDKKVQLNKIFQVNINFKRYRLSQQH